MTPLIYQHSIVDFQKATHRANIHRPIFHTFAHKLGDSNKIL